MLSKIEMCLWCIMFAVVTFYGPFNRMKNEVWDRGNGDCVRLIEATVKYKDH